LTDIYNVVQGDIPNIDIILLEVTNSDVRTRGMMMAYYHAKLNPPPGHLIPRQPALAGAMLGLLLNTVDYTRMLAYNNELTGHCHKAGFNPVFRVINTPEDLLAILRSPEVQHFLAKFGTGATLYLEDRAQQIIMLGPVLLTIGKNVQIEGYTGWMTRRLRGFMGTLGLDNSSIIWTDATYPIFSTMNALSIYLSSAFYLRREIFRICWAASSGQDRLSNLFKDVVSLLKGTSMTHIILIDEYLYHRYRELLSVRMLADNHAGIKAAWEFLASLPEHEVFYAKILYDKESTACLNRINFPLHIAAATAAAKFEIPSMAFYRGPDTKIQSINALATIVNTYLSRRLTLAPKAMINQLAAFSSSHEVLGYHRNVEQGADEASGITTAERGQPSFLAAPPGPPTAPPAQ
jgi:hypothetical protein